MKELQKYLRLWIPFFLFSNLVWAYSFWEWYPGAWTEPSRILLCVTISTMVTIMLIIYTTTKAQRTEKELQVIEAQTRYIEAKTRYLNDPYWRTREDVVDSLDIMDEALKTGKEK